MSDYDYVDPKVNRFMSQVRPEVEEIYNKIIRKEGLKQGNKTFNRCLVELISYLGLKRATEFLSTPITNYWR